MSLRIFDFIGRGQNINSEKSLEKVESTLMDDSEGFRTSVEEVTTDTVEMQESLNYKQSTERYD